MDVNQKPETQPQETQPQETLPQKQAAYTNEHLSYDLLQTILVDLGEELRKRRDPEYTYTAAAIASFGAVTLGVATIGAISNQRQVNGLLLLSIIAAVGILIVTIPVVFKIIREHNIYVKIKRQQVAVVTLMKKYIQLDETEIPYHYREVGKGKGYISSVIMVVAAAIAAISFCLAVYFIGF